MKDVIERIRKILSKTEEAGCTQAEAETAFKLASRLMAEHNLSMSEVQKDGTPDEDWTEEEGHRFGRWTMQCQLAAGIVKRFFYVEGFISEVYTGSARTTKVYRFFGKQSNVETAKWAFSSLLDAFDRLFNEHRSRTRCPATDRRAFVAGVARGFTDKMEEERQTVQDEQDVIRGSGGTALALRSIQAETKAKLAERHHLVSYGGSYTTPVRDSGGARQAGYVAGRNLNLARPIAGSKAKGLPA